MSTSPYPLPAADAAHGAGSPAPPAGTATRLLAGALGLATLLAAGLFTVGTAWAAPAGVGLARWAQRRRGRALTRPASWGAAVGAASVAVALGIGLVLASLPEGALTEAMAAAESAEPPPRPEWLERIAPPSAPPAPGVERVFSSGPATVYFGLVGFAMACLIMGSIAGSLGWAATLLVGYAARGRWPLGRRTG